MATTGSFGHQTCVDVQSLFVFQLLKIFPFEGLFFGDSQSNKATRPPFHLSSLTSSAPRSREETRKKRAESYFIKLQRFRGLSQKVGGPLHIELHHPDITLG